MTAEPTDKEVNQFLTRVIQTEEKYAFVKKGRETDRKEELRVLLEEFCK